MILIDEGGTAICLRVKLRVMNYLLGDTRNAGGDRVQGIMKGVEDPRTGTVVVVRPKHQSGRGAHYHLKMMHSNLQTSRKQAHRRQW